MTKDFLSSAAQGLPANVEVVDDTGKVVRSHVLTPGQAEQASQLIEKRHPLDGVAILKDVDPKGHVPPSFVDSYEAGYRDGFGAPIRKANHFLVHIDEEKLDASPGGTDWYRFLGPMETIIIKDGMKFHNLPEGDLAQMLGHPPLLHDDGTPILSDQDRLVVSAGLLLRHKVVRNPDMSTKEKKRTLLELQQQSYKKEFTDKLLGGAGLFTPSDGSKLTMNQYRVTGMEDANGAPRSFGESAATFNIVEIEALLGRKLTRDGNGKHEMSDAEAKFLGHALGSLETVRDHPKSEWARLIQSTVSLARTEFGDLPTMRLMNFLKEEIKHARREIRKERKAIDAKIDRHTLALGMLEELQPWLAGGMKLQRPDGSAMHKLREALAQSKVSVVLADSVERDGDANADLSACIKDTKSFVVEHNWAGVMASADVSGGDGTHEEIVMPYPDCCFEFVISGKRVITLVSEDPDGIRPTRIAPLVQCKDGFALVVTYTIGDDWKAVPLPIPQNEAREFQKVADLIIANIRAIGITLEAEVTQTEVVRVDAKLNRAREKRGKLPLYDYHVVSLANRHRVTSRNLPLDPDREYTRKRCHFRRAHWRHYADHKTRIPWCLAGDPELGFVDKVYRL